MVLLLVLYSLCLLEVFHGYQLINGQGKNFYLSQNQRSAFSLYDNDKNGNKNDNDDNKNRRSNSDDEDDSLKRRPSIKERSLLREYITSPTVPGDPESASIYPPKYILDEIEERDSYTVIKELPEGWETFEREDPRWLTAPVPGPGQTAYRKAYSRFTRWVRQLPSIELSLWRDHALYTLKNMKGVYDFNLDDYVRQGLGNLIDENAQKALEAGDEREFKKLAILSMQAQENEKDEVVSVINEYYDALSRRDRKAISLVWLPDPNSELILPGHNKARGVTQRLETYKLLNLEIKNFGIITPQIISVECFGNVAFVHSIDDVSLSAKAIARGTTKGRPEPKPLQPKRLFSTTVLRFVNKHWRIMIHHTMRFRHSSFTGDLPEIVIPPPKRATPSTSATASTTTSSASSGKSIVDLLKNPITVTNPTALQPGSIEQLALEEIRKLNNKEEKPAEVTSSSSPLLSSSALSRTSTPTTQTLYPEGISVTKKAIITLRYLVDRQLLTKTEKDMLVNYIIDSISEDKKSSVETAFNVLFGNEPENLLKESFDRSIEEFCDQCHEILLKLKEAEQELQQQQLAVEEFEEEDDDLNSDDSSEGRVLTKNMKMKNAAERLSRSISGIFKRNATTNPNKNIEPNTNIKKRGRKSKNSDRENEEDEE